MATDTNINRQRLIAGLAILFVLLVVVVFLLVRFLAQKPDRPRIGHRSPVDVLAYCGADVDRLCVVSFGQGEEGEMLVNFLTPDDSYPRFVLTIGHDGQEDPYECERVPAVPNGRLCRGAMQVPGQILDFRVISRNKGRLLAEGRFSIIGIALATPGNPLTGTPTATPTETPTITPTFVSTPTPSLTPSTPSYPNPSYP